MGTLVAMDTTLKALQDLKQQGVEAKDTRFVALVDREIASLSNPPDLLELTSWHQGGKKYSAQP